MLPFLKQGERGPLVVMLHWLGGSARTWNEVAAGLTARGMQAVGLDLPGFGEAANIEETSLVASVAAVVETVGALNTGEPWFLVGHSMGGKMAAIVARAALDGEPRLAGLRGLMLVSPSPPGVEPMDEATRTKMLEQMGQSTQDGAEDRRWAAHFVDDNTGKLPIAEAVCERAVDDVLRMNREAWVAWLTTGSKEDWSARVGTISLPALIVAGSEEPKLGPGAQREHTLPHFAAGTLVELVGSGHLSPLERPWEVVERLAGFVESCGVPLEVAALGLAFRALIESQRTSPQTRAVLLERLSEAGGVGVLGPQELLTLRALVRRVVPGYGFNLAARVDSWLALPEHDGWRHDELPPDADAWRIGLRSLDAAAVRESGVSFLGLEPERQDALLRRAQAGKFGRGLMGAVPFTEAAALFSAAQMQAWFGDVCGELAKMYVADPRTMERVGFTGFADGSGFTQIRLGEREEFEL